MEMELGFFQLSEESNTPLDDKFLAAVEIVQNMPKEGMSRQSLCLNAWKNLGDMDRNEAKATYISKIIAKIMSTNKEHNTKGWTQDELFDKLLPKFAMLGLYPTNIKSKSRSETLMEEQIHDPIKPQEVNGDEDHSHSDTRSHSSSPFPTSDMDYMDCCEDGRHLHVSHTLESYDEVEPPLSEIKSENAVIKYINKIENELKVLFDGLDVRR
ncbi:unnamed protein product [Strongylus vulgaris]|uniref:ACB domain-containing protein n=1 Tax=Strongylus vulgaris TaxID=40348 RepID=A0A3P7K7U7_STRVU|nr:unnamed protein product [Strongylus vulgaris]